jgi:hypothetical protein
MNRNKLKTYAPAARRDFIQAMTDRAAFYGLTASKTEPAVVRGDVAVIAGRDYPRAIAGKRKKLEARVERDGFEQTMEAMAYTWFNRLVAIRFMELHGYLEHGYRVLSHPDDKSTPEILEHAEHVDLPGLKRDTVIDLKLEGNKESELYRLLLTAQCNALHKAMPFLFERIDDETELLLPDNLLHSDSLIRKLVGGIEEGDWREVEIIGWLYQFYISEKKAQVIGKVVASADIPAATQLFTPNWIVKYLVQNTLGRRWLSTYPNSPLRAQMEYYIEPAAQTPDVTEELKAVTPTSLDPEALTMLDPACGSCHILVEGYDIFKAIYLERGYRLKDIPALILQKNLFGLEIDDRAAQLGAFALMMKARADDPRIFDRAPAPNIVALQNSQGMNAAAITQALNSPVNSGVPREYLFEEIEEERAGLFSKKNLATGAAIAEADIASLLNLFENAKTLGSLIRMQSDLKLKLPAVECRLKDVVQHGDLTQTSANALRPLLQQARLLTMQYGAVVANPPYMGRKYMTPELRSFAEAEYPEMSHDIFAMFIPRMYQFCEDNGFIGLMTPFTWMSINSYEKMRRWMVRDASLCTLIQPELHAFFDSAYVSICTFTLQKLKLQQKATFIDLSAFYGEELQPGRALEAIKNPDCSWRYQIAPSRFAELPTCQFTYQLSDSFFDVFRKCRLVSEYADVKEGLNTGDNDKFFRTWWEVPFATINFNLRSGSDDVGPTWVPCNRGGPFHRWYGNNESVIDWTNNGAEIKSFRSESGKLRSAVRNETFYFKPGITWSGVSSGKFHARAFEDGFIFNSVGRSMFPHDRREYLLGFLNSPVCDHLLATLAPTIHFSVGNIANLPIAFPEQDELVENVTDNVKRLIQLAKDDWDTYETSWGFAGSNVCNVSSETVESAFLEASQARKNARDEMRRLEAAVNTTMIVTHELSHVLSPVVSDEYLSIRDADREDCAKQILGYAIGCMMGRYSLDAPGLIYAQSGNKEFDPAKYTTFPVDDDGIVPLLSADLSSGDDVGGRFEEFVGAVWSKRKLEENLKFIADSLGTVGNEQPRDSIRRYFAVGFYKQHLSTYRKRPIYWLFTSGKQRAFQCLVYIHRYGEGTLSRMRTEYVIPLQGRLSSRLDYLEGEKIKATNTSQRKKLQKDQDDLRKQQIELLAFEEKLKHFADQKIGLNLNDGIKVNYSKFGDLLAEVETITGGKDDE